jgi:hypothetical protein
VTSKSAQRGALYGFFAPLVVFVVIVALGLAYWTVRRPSAPERPDQDRAIGTAGNTTPGGFDTAPRPDKTTDELKYRGVNQPPQGPMPPLHDNTPITKVSDFGGSNAIAGRPVDLDNVTVDRMEGDAFWVRDGNDLVQVVAAPGLALTKGGHVRVVGVAETAGSTARVKASKVEVR